MDKYEEAVTYFSKHKEEIYVAWVAPKQHPQGFLFAFLVHPRSERRFSGGYSVGCPTMIRANKRYVAFDKSRNVDWEFTESVRNNEKIPSFHHYPRDGYSPSELREIAEVQREYDRRTA